MTPAEPVDRFYAAVGRIARFWLWFFFKRVDVRHAERVPAGGPVLLCINHPNNLIDSLLVGAVLRRKVHYLATAALFRNPLRRALPPAVRRHPRLPAGRTTRPDGPQRRHVRGVLRRRSRDGPARRASIPRARRTRRRASSASRPAPRASPSSTRRARPGTAGSRSRSSRSGSPSRRASRSAGRVLVSFGEPVAVGAYLRRLPRRSRSRPSTRSPRDPVGDGGARSSTSSASTAPTSSRAVEELYRGELVQRAAGPSAGSRPRRSTRSGCRGDRRRGRPLPGARSRARRAALAAHPGATARCWPPIACATRRCARGSTAAGAAARPRLGRGRLVGLPALRLRRRASTSCPYYRAALARPPHRRARRRTTRRSRLLAAIVAFPLFWGLETWLVVAARRRRWALALRALASAERAHRLSLPGRRSDGCAAGSASRRWPLTPARPRAGCSPSAQAIIAELERARADYLAATKGSTLLSVHRLEEMSTPALDALDRARTVVMLTVSPLEEHGPHLPVGVDAFTARHLAEAIAERSSRRGRAGAPCWRRRLHLGSFTFETVGTISVRQRVVRDVVVDYGESLARARLPLHPGRQRPRRPRPSRRARGGRGDRLAPPRGDDGLVHRPPRVGVPARPLPSSRSRPRSAAPSPPTSARRSPRTPTAAGGRPR